jgi:hypothetical protein
MDMLREEGEYVRDEAAVALRTISYRNKLFIARVGESSKRRP